MAKVLIKNAVGDKIVKNYIPASWENAKTFAEKYLQGTYKGYAQIKQIGNETATTAKDVQLQFKDTTTGKKGYLRLILKGSTSVNEFGALLVGKTINGITIDSVSFISVSSIVTA